MPLISQTAEYALRAVVCLASQPDRPLVTQQIAGATRVPAGYLSKVLQSLVRAGLVQSQRGLHGGFTLTRDPGSLTVLEVINAVDPLKRILRCPLGIPGHGGHAGGLCPLHRSLDDAVAQIEDSFGRHTIDQLLSESGRHPMGQQASRCPGPVLAK